MKKGFTLIEVLVGMAILAVVVFLIWSISSSNLDSIERVEKRDNVFQMGRLALGKITDDINMAFLVANPQLLGKTKDSSNIETAFIGSERGDFDVLDFDSLSHWRMFRDAKESDQCEIGYYAEKDPENPDVYKLMRRESTVLDDDVTKGGKAYPVAEGINSFKLRYYDPRSNEWTDNWNTKEIDQKGVLPRAVNMVISFPDPVNVEESIKFETTVFIGLWQNSIDF